VKLYLSSYRIGNAGDKLTTLTTDNPTAAIIMNAIDLDSANDRQIKLDAEITSLAALNITSEELDLRNYFANPAELLTRLNQYGLIWVRGGNSFVLRRAMRLSGFDIIALPLLETNQLVYGGYSAGAVVAGPTLRGIELVDDPDTVPDGYSEPIIWDGLQLYASSIAPHYQSQHPESAAIDATITYYQTKKLPYKALRDGEVIIVDTVA
jgi:dipeptidase E